jgi:hypothetical protein
MLLAGLVLELPQELRIRVNCCSFGAWPALISVSTSASSALREPFQSPFR